MTTKQKFIPIFEMLCTAYSGRLVKVNASERERASVMVVWYELLSDLPAEALQAASLEFMSSPSAFPPTPGQVRGKAVELSKRANQVPSAAEAWEIILGAPVDGKRAWSEEQVDGSWVIYNADYKFPHPLVEKVARNLGWPKSFWTDNLVSDRSKFMAAYEVAEDKATVEVTSLPQVREYVARLGRGDVAELAAGFRREALDRGKGEQG